MNDSELADSSVEGQQTDFISQALSLLESLEASLRSGHRAVLVRDVAQLEELTRQQARLLSALSSLWRRPSPLSSPDVHLAQLRVLHLALVQRALLARSNRRLTMLGHLLAGTHADYSFAAARNTISLSSSARRNSLSFTEA